MTRLRLASLLLCVAWGGPALAQGAPVLSLAPADPGGEALGAGFAAGAESLLGAGGEFASCLATLGGEGATHRVVLRSQAAEGGLAWVAEFVAEPGGEVMQSLSGTGGEGALAAQGEALAREVLAPLCELADGPEAAAWDASGGGAEIAITGRVTSLETVFTLQGTFPGGTAEFTYTPVSPGGGAVEYAAAGSGVTASGEGIYSLTPQGDGTILLEQTTDGCVDGIPNSCRTNTEVITLTPVAP